MATAMPLGALRRCEVLGLRLTDVNAGERRVFVAEGKGATNAPFPSRPGSSRAVGDYLLHERPLDDCTDRLFGVLKGPRRGRPLSASGLDEVIGSARTRAGIDRLNCHQLRHTCMTRLREAGMALEAVQAQRAAAADTRYGWQRVRCNSLLTSSTRPCRPSSEANGPNCRD
jgi:integrase